MGLFDRLTGTGRQKSAPSESNFELTVTVGDEISTFSIPIELTDEGPAFLDPQREGTPQTPDQCWVPSDREVELAGRHIGGGLFYLGENLSASGRGFPILEPALVDPSLEVASRSSGEGPSRFYWPSYQRLSPADRAAYLEWLAGPRRAREISQSLAFLYLYGLERRLLADPGESSTAASERAAIVEELTRLQGEVEEDQERASLAHQLGQLLEFSAAQDLLQGHGNPPPPKERTGWQVPLILRLMLGEVAAAGLPLPAELALSWTLTSPEAHLRTPAQRCREEFSSLFEVRYRERFGDGLSLPRSGRLQIGYRASSPGLGEVGEPTSLPDVADSPKLVEPLRELAQNCCAELDPYSRLLGRKPAEAESLKGVALLPAPLLEAHAHDELKQLRELLQEASLGDRPWLLGANDLLARWPGDRPKLPKKEAVSLVQLMEKLGYGIEPDVRFGGSAPTSGGAVVIFPIQEHDPRTPSPAYATAAMLLDLVAAIAAADGTVTPEEKRHLEAHIESAADLDSGERERLRAHVEQVTRSKPSFAGLRKKLEPLTADQKERIGSGLVAVAAADGHISPEEVKILGKVFDLLGLDPDSVYTEAHAAAAGATADAGEPAVVSADRPGPANGENRGALDRSAIETRIEETARVSSMLAGIFDSEDDAEADPAAPPPTGDDPSNGLDPAQAAFVRDLIERTSWARAEVEELAARHDLLVDGALETINNAAFERCDAPFSEGDDPIEIDVEVASEVLA
jgi:tellurite resistance protein